MLTTSADAAGVSEGEIAERPVSVTEAIEIVMRSLRSGQIDDAETICRKILEVAPDHPDATHYLGIVEHKNGRTAEGLALIRRSLELAPAQPDWHSNFGILLQAQDDLEGAIESFRQALTIDPSHANAHGNLGVLLRVLGRHEEAEAEYRRAIALNPQHADAYRNLAILLSVTGRTEEAVTAYCRALTLKPDIPEGHRLLAIAYRMLGETEKAILVCEEWVRAKPEDAVAKHTLAAISGRDVPIRATDAYVQQVFDGFSRTFEAKLAKLEYRAPDLVVVSLAATGIPADRSRHVLDLGCGTGLCGPLLASYAARLVGIDLSAGMLEHARDKRVYDDLVQAELTDYASRHPDAFDVIVSADTLVYFGVLDEALFASARALRPGGWLVFTAEEAVDPASPDFAIQPHGRYCHRADYIERLLTAAGLDVHIDRGELRKEQGQPVPGLIVRASRRVARADGGGHHG
jgi:predicted TPR repeat methyltransferase